MDQNMKGATVEECLKNVWRMPKIWQNFKNITDWLTEWLSNMDPRDASASKNILSVPFSNSDFVSWWPRSEPAPAASLCSTSVAQQARCTLQLLKGGKTHRPIILNNNNNNNNSRHQGLCPLHAALNFTRLHANEIERRVFSSPDLTTLWVRLMPMLPMWQRLHSSWRFFYDEVAQIDSLLSHIF